MATIENGITYHTPEELARWEESLRLNPDHAVTRALVVRYARETGGLTLEYWRRLVGPWFGEPQLMPPKRVGEVLGVSLSELEQVHQATWAWVEPRRDRDPQYQHFRARRERLRREQLGDS